MELSIKFRDVPREVSFVVRENTVLYGYNGSGKTRVLKTIKDISDIDKENANLLDIFEKYNIENLMIDTVSLQSLLEEESNLTIVNKNFVDEFVELNRGAFVDFSWTINRIIETNRVVPFFPISRLRTIIRRLKPIMEHQENSDMDLTRELNIVLRNSFIILNEIQRNLKHLEFDSLNRESQIELALDIHGFIQRRFEDYKFDNEKRINRRGAFRKAYKQSKLDTLSLRAKYISTHFEELDLIKNKIEKDLIMLKTKLSSEYVTKISKLLKEEDIDVGGNVGINDENLRNFLKKFDKTNKVIKKYMEVEMHLDGNNLLVKKQESKLELSQLSSGEQRFLILILNIIFSSEKLLLIDEPEISLSLNFQSKIMDDLVDLLGEKKLILATHAPFVFKACERLDFNLVEL